VTEGAAEFITSFGQDAVGNLYIGTVNGQVFRIVTDAVTPGDFDEDADVDADDLPIWQANYGMSGAPAALPGDANDDGVVDGGDFLAWQVHLGYDAASPALTQASVVPEASSGMLGAVALVLAAPRRRSAPV
jgi:MYXO-CTERM domain-containing protein